MRPRVIPALLIQDGEMIKTTNFKKPNYIGDPINTLKLFNDLEVDELVVLDIGRSKSNESPDLAALEEMATECFIPLCYGGGVKTIEMMAEIFSTGIEKISINSAALDDFSILEKAVERFGAQSIVLSIDVKKNLMGNYKVYDHRTQKNTSHELADYINMANDVPVGEILVNSVDMDGKMSGYDLKLIQNLADNIKVPYINCGGAGELTDISQAIQAGADAVAAGSLFIYQNKERGVLVNYPSQDKLDELLGM